MKFKVLMRVTGLINYALVQIFFGKFGWNENLEGYEINHLNLNLQTFRESFSLANERNSSRYK
mgnify:CR=1 FL=1